MEWKEMIFLALLVWAAWEDFRTKSIGTRGLWFFGGVGIILGCLEMISGQINTVVWYERLLSCGIGWLLLGLSGVTGGGIGEGDGWFFVVSGMYLTWVENLQLFLSGLCLCFIWSLPLVWKVLLKNGNGRTCAVPFLPFLLPAGIWIAVT